MENVAPRSYKKLGDWKTGSIKDVIEIWLKGIIEGYQNFRKEALSENVLERFALIALPEIELRLGTADTVFHHVENTMNAYALSEVNIETERTKGVVYGCQVSACENVKRSFYANVLESDSNAISENKNCILSTKEESVTIQLPDGERFVKKREKNKQWTYYKEGKKKQGGNLDLATPCRIADLRFGAAIETKLKTYDTTYGEKEFKTQMDACKTEMSNTPRYRNRSIYIYQDCKSWEIHITKVHDGIAHRCETHAHKNSIKVCGSDEDCDECEVNKCENYANYANYKIEVEIELTALNELGIDTTVGIGINSTDLNDRRIDVIVREVMQIIWHVLPKQTSEPPRPLLTGITRVDQTMCHIAKHMIYGPNVAPSVLQRWHTESEQVRQGHIAKALPGVRMLLVCFEEITVADEAKIAIREKLENSSVEQYQIMNSDELYSSAESWTTILRFIYPDVQKTHEQSNLSVTDIEKNWDQTYTTATNLLEIQIDAMRQAIAQSSPNITRLFGFLSDADGMDKTNKTKAINNLTKLNEFVKKQIKILTKNKEPLTNQEEWIGFILSNEMKNYVKKINPNMYFEEMAQDLTFLKTIYEDLTKNSQVGLVSPHQMESQLLTCIIQEYISKLKIIDNEENKKQKLIARLVDEQGRVYSRSNAGVDKYIQDLQTVKYLEYYKMIEGGKTLITLHPMLQFLGDCILEVNFVHDKGTEMKIQITDAHRVHGKSWRNIPFETRNTNLDAEIQKYKPSSQESTNKFIEINQMQWDLDLATIENLNDYNDRYLIRPKGCDQVLEFADPSKLTAILDLDLSSQQFGIYSDNTGKIVRISQSVAFWDRAEYARVSRRFIRHMKSGQAAFTYRSGEWHLVNAQIDARPAHMIEFHSVTMALQSNMRTDEFLIRMRSKTWDETRQQINKRKNQHKDLYDRVLKTPKKSKLVS